MNNYEKRRRVLHQVSNMFRHPDFRMSYELMDYLVRVTELEESGLLLLMRMEKRKARSNE